MASRAQLSQARSRARRDALLEAALELFSEGGSRAVTHRGVAARAGLPAASTTYYFASIDGLVQEALSHHLQQWIDTLSALTDMDFDASVDVETASTFIEEIFMTRSPEIAGMQLSIYLAAARDPELVDLAAQAMRALDELVTSALGRLGVDQPEALASSITALIAGVAFRRQTEDHSETEEARLLAQAMRQLAAAHILGEDVVREALRRG